jgi:hypothetical protein
MFIEHLQGRDCVRTACCLRLSRLLPLLKVLNASDSFLCVADHLPKQVCKASLAELLRPTAVQRSVVYCLAVRWISQARLRSPLAICDLADEGGFGRLGGRHFTYLSRMAYAESNVLAHKTCRCTPLVSRELTWVLMQAKRDKRQNHFTNL